jgi:hypothetical protein
MVSSVAVSSIATVFEPGGSIGPEPGVVIKTTDLLELALGYRVASQLVA